jgi:hypothetical protein
MKYIFEGDDFERLRHKHVGTSIWSILHAFSDRYPGKVELAENTPNDYYRIQVSILDPYVQDRFDASVLNRVFDWNSRMRRMHAVKSKRETLRIERDLLRFQCQVDLPAKVSNDQFQIFWKRIQNLFGEPDPGGDWYLYRSKVYCIHSKMALQISLLLP